MTLLRTQKLRKEVRPPSLPETDERRKSKRRKATVRPISQGCDCCND